MNTPSPPDHEFERRIASRLLDVLIRAGLIGVLAVLCYKVFAPFLTLMVWAIILAVTMYPLQQSVARANAMPRGEGPIVLLDHYDNCASGGTMDTTVVLAEILRQGLDNVAAFAIYDPEAVRQAIAAGVGSEITLSIGGKRPATQMPGGFVYPVFSARGRDPSPPTA